MLSNSGLCTIEEGILTSLFTQLPRRGLLGNRAFGIANPQKSEGVTVTFLAYRIHICSYL
jgi:hypothetical protein